MPCARDGVVDLHSKDLTSIFFFFFFFFLFQNETLVPLNNVSTGGLGDGLGQFGVSRVASVSCLDFLYASNDATQSISVFRVNRQDGSLTLLPSLAVVVVPRNVMAYDDVAVTLSPNGRFLFVGLGSSFVSNHVYVYAVNNVSGALTQVAHVVVPTISLPLRLSQLAVSPTGNLLAVSLTSVAGYVALYGIDPNSGALTELDLLPDQAPYGRAQGLVWSADGSEIFAALVNNRPPSVGAIGVSVSQNRTLGLEWTLNSQVSDDSNLIALDKRTGNKLFLSTQMPALVVTPKPLTPPVYTVTLTPSGFVPSLLSLEFGATVVFNATLPGFSVVLVSSGISCLPKADGFDSGPLVPGVPWRHTFDLAGTYYIADRARCTIGYRMVAQVDPAIVWKDPSAIVNPLRARSTMLDVTFDGDHLVSSLQTGGVSIYRILANYSLAEVAVGAYDAKGLQGTSALFNMPQCCKVDDSGPILDFQPVITVPCTYKITQPFIKLVAGCDYLANQLVTEAVLLPTCNQQCDALFHVSLTDGGNPRI